MADTKKNTLLTPQSTKPFFEKIRPPKPVFPNFPKPVFRPQKAFGNRGK